MKLQFHRALQFGLPFAICGLLFCAPSVGGGAEKNAVEITRRLSAMGTALELSVWALDRDTALTASEEAVAAVEDVESRLSTWRPGSELSRLNRIAAGTRVAISQQLESNLREAGHWWAETGAAFDPGVASLVSIWGLREGGRLPSGPEMVAALAAAGYENLVLQSGFAKRLREDFGVEEGAFGKGVALREACRAALEEGARCVLADFGGQVEIQGECPERPISIADPWDRNRYLAELNLSRGSVATSGNSERGMNVDGIPVGHLLDPRTGLPVPMWGSVTVVANDAVTADVVATALYVMGPQHGAEWMRGREGLEAVFFEGSRGSVTITATAGLSDRLKLSDENVVAHEEVIPGFAWFKNHNE